MAYKNWMMKEMDGQEILSLQFEGVVAVENGKVLISHSQQWIKPTKEQIAELWEEMIEQEFGTRHPTIDM